MSARRRAPLLPSRAVLRDPVRRRAWLGGFNLLPYRRRDARRERRRRLLELAGAVGLGVAGVALACAMQGLERKRIDARRLVLEQQLVAWAPRLQAAEAAGRERETRRDRAAAAAELTRPLLRAITLFEVLHRLDYRAVMLIALRQAEGGVRIDARARDSLAASRWLARLREARSDWQVEMSGVEGEPGQGTTGTIRFAVRIRWPDAVPLPRAARADFSVARGGRR